MLTRRKHNKPLLDGGDTKHDGKIKMESFPDVVGMAAY
tara:strand:+ start:1166 stop:1279 length:114 start_codon:yes stop_codon:yes gene_type:complete